jgi:hypothetical protein
MVVAEAKALSENEAKAAGRRYRMAKMPMEAVLRARTLSETRGFMKALVGHDSDEILGFTALGPHAGEAVSFRQACMTDTEWLCWCRSTPTGLEDRPMRQSAAVVPNKIEDLRQRLEHWRSTHKRRGRIPETLWAEALLLNAPKEADRCILTDAG